MHIARRMFFKALLGLSSAALATRREPATARAERHYLLNRFHIAGFCYHEGLSIVADLSVGQELQLRAEPDNPHDRYAVALQVGDRMLGYVPRTDNRHLSRLLRQNAPLYARVVDVRPNENTWRMVRVEVTMRV